MPGRGTNGAEMTTNNTNGMMTDERFKTNNQGSLEIARRAMIAKAYIAKTAAGKGGVKTIVLINKKTLIILTRESRLWTGLIKSA